MVQCRYVGGDVSNINDLEFDSVGQRATFSESGYREVVLGGAAFITESMFSKVGFSQKELDQWGPTGSRIEPSESFSNKLLLAQRMYLEVKGLFGSLKGLDVLAEAAEASQ